MEKFFYSLFEKSRSLGRDLARFSKSVNEEGVEFDNVIIRQEMAKTEQEAKEKDIFTPKGAERAKKRAILERRIIRIFERNKIG